VRVKVLDVDQRGRIKLSIKEAKAEEGTDSDAATVDAVEAEDLTEE